MLMTTSLPDAAGAVATAACNDSLAIDTVGRVLSEQEFFSDRRAETVRRHATVFGLMLRYSGAATLSDVGQPQIAWFPLVRQLREGKVVEWHRERLTVPKPGILLAGAIRDLERR